MTAEVPIIQLWRYRAKLVRVIDGDTIVVDIDKGFGDWRHGEHIRLAGIDAPEVRGEEREAGREAARFLEDLLDRRKGPYLYLITDRDRTGKFGRYIARVVIDTPDGPVDVCEALVQAGHAERVEF